jgi:hypothetical protein
MIRHRSALFAPVPHLPLGVPRVILWDITVQQTPGKVVLLAEVKEGRLILEDLQLFLQN